MSNVERRMRLDQPDRHPHDLAYRTCLDHEVMLKASRPPDPRAVVKDDESQSATDVLRRHSLSALKHAPNIAI